MNDKTEAKRPRKRWKRVVKWTVGTIFVALILCGFVAYWTSTNEQYLEQGHARGKLVITVE